MTILSLTDARVALKLDEGDTRDDDEMRGWIEAAEEAVRFMAGVPDQLTVVDEWVETDLSVCLRWHPLISLDAITEMDGTPVDLSIAWHINYRSSILQLAPQYVRRGLKVSYTAGRPELPAAAKAACLIIFRHLWSTTRSAGAPQAAGFNRTDDVVQVQGLGYAVPRRAVELLRSLTADNPGIA